MNSKKLEISKERAYAINYLDNGGLLSNFPQKHKKLHEAIKIEEKRRVFVQIRYLIDNNKTFKTKMYKLLKINNKTSIEPIELYKKLNTLTNNQLYSYLQDVEE